MAEIKIKRNGNEITISKKTGRYGNNYINTTINGKEYSAGFKLNNKNQWVAQQYQIGVQLTTEQAENIKNMINELDEAEKAKDEKLRAEIKNKEVKTLSFKFHNYYIEKYMHTESVQLSNHKTIYSEEGYKIMDAVRCLSPQELSQIGIKQIDGVWQEIALTDELKKFIFERAKINEAETKKEIEKEREEKEAKKAKLEKEKESKRDEMLELAVKTGEKQVLNMTSVLADDGNLILIYTYIHPDGSESKREFYDGD